MKTLNLTPPNDGLFAGVQVEHGDREIVGAATAFRVEGEGENAKMVPLAHVSVACHHFPRDAEVRAVWAYEDSTLPNETVTVQHAEQPRPARHGGR